MTDANTANAQDALAITMTAYTELLGAVNAGCDLYDPQRRRELHEGIANRVQFHYAQGVTAGYQKAKAEAEAAKAKAAARPDSDSYLPGLLGLLGRECGESGRKALAAPGTVPFFESDAHRNPQPAYARMNAIIQRARQGEFIKPTDLQDAIRAIEDVSRHNAIMDAACYLSEKAGATEAKTDTKPETKRGRIGKRE